MYQAGKFGDGLRDRSPKPMVAPQGQSETAFAADFKLSPVPQVALDRNGIIRRINVAAAVLLKGEPDQLTNVPFIAFVDKAYCRVFLDHFAAATTTKQKICTRLALSSATRATGPVDLQTNSSIDPITGRVFCRTAIVSFSSSRRVANGILGNKAEYQEWFELFPDAAFLELGGRIISTNPGALSLLGAKTADEIQGRDLLEIVHADSRQSFSDRLSHLPIGKSEPIGADEKFIRLDGREIVVRVILKSIDFEGAFATLVVARDLSEERAMRENLMQAKTLSAQVLANNSLATAIVSIESGRFLQTNEVFCRLAGRPQEQIVGQSFSAIHLVGPNVDLLDFVNFASQTGGEEFEAKLDRTDGSVLDVLVSAKMILSGEERCLLLMMQDLTDLRRLRKDVITISEEERRRFSRDLHDSHCQDLTAIAFFAETIATNLATRDNEAAKQVRLLVDMVQKSAENVHALAAGLDSQQVQESGLVVALEDLASRTTRRFGLACTAKLDPLLGQLDSTQAINLYRIAQEAVSNAARHSRAHTIILRLRRDGATGILEVQDDGIGFSPAKNSNGLGLRTMHYRASLIRGNLDIDSKPGAGTVVICSFPVLRE
jgi:two-component system, LuxR family, sensor kinase FixL